MKVLILIFSLVVLTPGSSVKSLYINGQLKNGIKDPERLDSLGLHNFEKQIEKSQLKDWSYWEKGLGQAQELGYGLTLREGRQSAGTFTIRYNFVYKNGKLFTGKFWIRKPSDSDDTPSTAQLLKDYFIHEDKYNYYFYINQKNAKTPSKQVLSQIPKNFEILLSPYLQGNYGYRGGLGMGVVGYREEFYLITKESTPTEMQQLLYSHSPLIRLYAGEYFIEYPQHQNPEILKRISDNAISVEKMDTITGCMGYSESTKDLFEKFSKMNLRKKYFKASP